MVSHGTGLVFYLLQYQPKYATNQLMFTRVFPRCQLSLYLGHAYILDRFNSDITVFMRRK